MAYKISIKTTTSVKPDAAQESTTRVSIAGDTPEEAEQICRLLEAMRGWGYPSSRDTLETEGPSPPVVSPPALEAGPTLPDGQSEPSVLPPNEDSDSLPLGQAVAAYLATLVAGGLADTTRRSYGYILNSLARELGPARGVRQITSDEMVSYLGRFREDGKATSTVLAYGRIMKLFFGWLIKRGDIEKNPTAAIKLQVPRWKPVPPFTEDDASRLLQAASGPFERAVVVLLLDTGMRASELTGLQLDSIDLVAGEIRVLGKGGKVRTLSLNERPKQALLAHLNSRAQRGKLVWPKEWNRRMLAAMLHQIGRRAKVPRVFPHRFRHTFATNFYRDTGNPLALQALMGHSSLIMVHRYIAAGQAEIALATHKQHSPTAGLATE